MKKLIVISALVVVGMVPATATAKPVEPRDLFPSLDRNHAYKSCGYDSLRVALSCRVKRVSSL